MVSRRREASENDTPDGGGFDEEVVRRKVVVASQTGVRSSAESPSKRILVIAFAQVGHSRSHRILQNEWTPLL